MAICCPNSLPEFLQTWDGRMGQTLESEEEVTGSHCLHWTFIRTLRTADEMSKPI